MERRNSILNDIKYILNMKVITFDGSEANKKECARIKGEYYIIGNPKEKDSGQCYPLTNSSGETKRYRINSGYITWDWEQERYVIINEEPDLIEGLTPDGMGYFSYNKYKNVKIRKYPYYDDRMAAQMSEKWCFDEATAKKHNAILSIVDGYWYLTGTKRSLNSHRNFYGKVRYDYFDHVYNLADSNQYGQMVREFRHRNIEVLDGVDQLHKLFDNISFGAELETSSGRLQEKDLWEYALIPLRDGSISNHEYVTIPFRDSRGLQKYIEGLETLQNTCTVNQSCSLHYHLGNVIEREANPKLFMVTLYTLYYLVQKEIWQMIPPYKKSLDYIRTKREMKDHCKDLNSLLLLDYEIYDHNGNINEKELEAAFKTLFTFWNDGHKPDSDHNYKTRRHVRQGQDKWHIKSRYYALNMYNALFSNSNTLEYRAHGGTVNVDKSLAWLLICIAITRFASKYSKEIMTQQIKPSLKLIVSEFKDNFGKEDIDPEFGIFIVNYLLEYIRTRQRHFVDMYLTDNIYAEEFDNDSGYSFAFDKMKLYEWKKK